MHKTFNRLCLMAALILVGCASDDPTPETQTAEQVEIEQARQAIITPGYCNTHQAQCEQWCENHPVLCGVICNHFPNIPLCDDDEPMCLEVGQTCLDEEENPGTPLCCDLETVGCFRGTCTEETENPPGCLPPDAECTIGVSTCCSPGRFDPLNECLAGEETPPGVGNCVPAG